MHAGLLVSCTMLLRYHSLTNGEIALCLVNFQRNACDKKVLLHLKAQMAAQKLLNMLKSAKLPFCNKRCC